MSRELMSAMEALNKISQDVKKEVDDDDSAVEYNEDFLSDYMADTVCHKLQFEIK